jgi:hypothetical protein
MKKKSNKYGTASLVLGILSLFFGLAPYIGIILAIIAIVFYSKQHKIEPNGVATGGLVTGILGTIFNGIILFIIIIALVIGHSVYENAIVDVDSEIHSNSLNTQEASKISETTNTDSKVNNHLVIENYSADLIIDRIPITLANLYPVRVTINNKGSKKINSKFDMQVKNSIGEIVCEGSSLSDDFSNIYSGKSVTGEISFLGCIFNEDGVYNLKIDLLDPNYNVLSSDSKKFEVNYWDQYN